MTRTAKATEARMRAADVKMANLLRNRGWHVYGPDQTLQVETQLPIHGAGGDVSEVRLWVYLGRES